MSSSRFFMSASIALWAFVGGTAESWANCVGNGSGRQYLSVADASMAKMHLGVVNLGGSSYMQPVGSVLATAVIPSTAYTYNGVTASSVLWVCDLADLHALYFLVATNGDERRSGQWEGGADFNMDDVYYTYFNWVGIRAQMGGTVIGRHYRRVPLGTYDVVGNKVHIRLGDIPPLHVQLHRLKNQHPPSAGGDACGASGAPAAPPGRNYGCAQPSVYIQLKGPGIGSDEEGADSASSYAFWWATNGFGYGLWNSATFVDQPTCRVNMATSVVWFPTISVRELTAGGKREQPFSVQLECSNSARSGTSSGQTAMGIRVSLGAYNAATKLNLIVGQNGVRALVSDNYGNDPGLAEGVAVTIRNAAGGEALTLIGQPGSTGGDAKAGWYPVLDNALNLGASQEPGHSRYTRNFIATLGALDGVTIKPGRYRATAYVQVRVQ